MIFALFSMCYPLEIGVVVKCVFCHSLLCAHSKGVRPGPGTLDTTAKVLPAIKTRLPSTTFSPPTFKTLTSPTFKNLPHHAPRLDQLHSKCHSALQSLHLRHHSQDCLYTLHLHAPTCAPLAKSSWMFLSMCLPCSR